MNVYAFCGLSSNSSIDWWTYMWDMENNRANKCFELVVGVIAHLLLFTYSVYVVFLVCFIQSSVLRPLQRHLLVVIGIRICCALSTAVLHLILAIFGFFKVASVNLSVICQIEFLFQAVVWLFYALLLFICVCRGIKLDLFVSGILWCFVFSSIALEFYDVLMAERLKFSLRIVLHLLIVISQVFYLMTLILHHCIKQRLTADLEPLIDNEEAEIILGSGDDDKWWISKLFFCWTNKLMKKGYLGQLKSVQNLYTLPRNLDVFTIDNRFEKARLQIRSGHQNILIQSLWRAFGVEYFSLGILKFVGDMLSFAGPILLHYLVTFVQLKNEPMLHGYLYAGGMGFSIFLSAMFTMHFSYLMSKVALKCRSALVLALYKKLLRVSLATLGDGNFSTGELVNFMSTDMDRIVNFCPSFHEVWGMPLQLGIALFLLYREVGLAFLTGLGFAVLLVPVNKVIASKIGSLSEQMMHFKDQRVKLMTELLFGVRVVKLSAWENHFGAKVNQIRQKELHYLKGRKYLDALCVYLWASAPVVIAILTFVTYSLLGHRLTAAKVFTTLALLNILIRPLNAFPWVLNGLIEAAVSIRRLERFLKADEIDWNALYCTDMCPLDPLSDMCIHNGKFTWSKNAQKNNFSISNLNMGFAKGHLIGIIGPVGCGKSSLFASICAELHKDSGHLFISVEDLENGFGLVTQEPWLQHGTIRDGILFGKMYKEEWYQDVIDACALRADLKLMPAGDMSEIGEQGVTLSGGQKARIALARAVYQDKLIYILDDPLSAVDAKVGSHLFHKCILGLLKNHGKLVLLSTHHLQFLEQQADLLFLFNNEGIVDKCGPPSDVIPSVQLAEVSSESDHVQKSNELQAGEELGGDEPVLVQDEEKEVGGVQFGVYLLYMAAVGSCLSFLIFTALFLMQASKNGIDWWLAYWVGHIADHKSANTSIKESDTPIGHKEHDLRILSTYRYPYSLLLTESSFVWNRKSDMNSGDNVTFYLTVYGGLAAVNSIFALARAFLFAFGGICAAKTIHKRLLGRILKAPVHFFDTTPVGRLVNRFSSDLYAVDETLPFQANILLMFLFAVCGTLIMISFGLPWFLICIVVASVFYYKIQFYYRHSTCELKRLTSTSLSPIYTHFTDTVTGLQTIRAFRAVDRFIELIGEKVCLNQRAQFSTLACSQWLAVRMQLLGVCLVSCVTFIALLQHQFQTVDPGLVGLAISYALSMTGILSGLLQYFTETEKELVSVERISHYIKNAPVESSFSSATMKAPAAWPAVGRVEFQGVSLRYGKNFPLALRNVSFVAEPGNRVGIIGRTGSGKSSLFQALFRSVELESGQGGLILVDGLNIALISLLELRSGLCIIPQTPFLLSGTLKDNVDILSSYPEQKVLWAIHQCGLESLAQRLGGLNGAVGERGSNLSVGEKQLVCLARALLRASKIVCIDEATAHVDRETDKAVQRVLRQAFKDCTVLTIAHRLETVRDYDRIIVMDKGVISGQGRPAEILGYY